MTALAPACSAFSASAPASAGPLVNTEPFLGVGSSFNGRRWRLRGTDERLGLTLAQRLGVPELVGRVLAGRGIGLDEAPLFLAPTLRDLMPDPDHLLDMAPAAERLARAVQEGEGIALFGDYDVDGATSAALLKRFLLAAGAARVLVHIPDRLAEGYGPNIKALRKLQEDGARVVVTVDCGTTAFDPLEEAARLGLDVIVIDHHVAEPALPKALAVVNPNRLDETSPHGQLAAVGVAFLVAVATNRRLREAGWYGLAGRTGDSPHRQEPDLRAWLDLVALGTVCDVVPLSGFNRALVAQGLKIMAKRGNLGLRALADVAGLREAPDAYHLGFLLGPRVNAGGRVGEAPLGERLLSTPDLAEAEEIASRLDSYNRERQAIEAEVLAAAQAQIEALHPPHQPAPPLLLAHGEGWHPGVIGIVAGRLKERYDRPCFVLAEEGHTAKGSGRSVSGIDLGAMVIAARQQGLLEAGGGHAMAAGLTVARERIEALRTFFNERIGAALAAGEVTPSLSLDGALRPGGATWSLVSALEKLSPFGSGNPRPRFALPQVRLSRVEVVGSGHLRCFIKDDEGKRTLKGIAFRAFDAAPGVTSLGDQLTAAADRPLHLAGTLKPDTWQGRENVQFQIEDAAWT